MNTASLTEFDRDTIDYLRAVGVDEGLISRVLAAMTAPDPDLSRVDTYAMAAELTKRGFLKVDMTL